ncbi:MAG: response regulator transcription factor [Patescibacteria group bacterium]|jgi:DNA-binding response OmpR family regulator
MRILLVEDEHKIAHALKRGLEQESYAVDVLYDGEAGMARALRGNYDLLILDRMLPGGHDGLEICRAIRTKGLHQPVLILTARDKTSDRVEGLDCGADDYLVKPFSFEELLARIRALLRRPNQSIGTLLKVGNLELHPETFTVRRGEQSIELSNKEFALLEYLMRNPGRIITKEQLIQHVWDFDADILPNTVEAFIASLRKKIDKPFNQPEMIKTVRGFGYQLNQPQ